MTDHASYRPTDRQLGALARMEEYLGVRSNRTAFTDRDAFQEYWQLLAGRCDGKSRHRASETPAARATQRQRRAEAVIKHYNDEANLLDYAKRYLARYGPSSAKLRAQLLRKAANEGLCDAVMATLGERIDDAARAVELAERLQRQGRNLAHIRQKLSQRRFDQAVIAQALRSLVGETGSAWEDDALRRVVAQLRRKGRSRQAIRATLVERPGDAAPVDAELTRVFGEEGDDPALRTAIERLRSRGIEEQGAIRRLAAKGFRIADIKRLLAVD